MKPEKDNRYIGYWLIFAGMICRMVGFSYVGFVGYGLIIAGLCYSFKLENNSKKAFGFFVAFMALNIVSMIYSSSIAKDIVKQTQELSDSVKSGAVNNQAVIDNIISTMESLFDISTMGVLIGFGMVAEIMYLFYYRFLMKDCSQIGILRGKPLHADKCSINGRWYTRGTIIMLIAQVAMIIVAYTAGPDLLSFMRKVLEYSVSSDQRAIESYLESYGPSMSGKIIILSICFLAYTVGAVMAGIAHIIGIIRVAQTAGMGVNPPEDTSYGYRY